MTIILFCFRKSGTKRKSGLLWLHKPKKKKKTNQKSTPNIKKDETILPSSTKLLRAPSKIKHKRSLKQKRKLFQVSEQEQLIEEMVELIPTVMKKLQKEQLLVDFCQFMRLISKEKLPLQNIALLLLFDVVRWYSVDNTSKMFYSDSCLKFWKVMYRLFHGKVLRFMSGIKSTGQVVKDMSSKGSYDPQTTSINFAVPNTNSIRQFNTSETEIPGELPPGIIHQAIQLKSSADNSYVLSVDGKKLAPGLTEKNGDQDLFGHEDGISLEMSRERIEQELITVETTVSQWSNFSTDIKIEKIKQELKNKEMDFDYPPS